MTYVLVDGKMPPEFHQKHLINNFSRSVSVECMLCGFEETHEKDEAYQTETDEKAAEAIYLNGWRYVSSQEYQCEGLACAECIENGDATESADMSQPLKTAQEILRKRVNNDVAALLELVRLLRKHDTVQDPSLFAQIQIGELRQDLERIRFFADDILKAVTEDDDV